MKLSHDAAKQVAGGVFLLAFAALFPLAFSLEGIVGDGGVIFAAFFTTFVVAPGIGLVTYLHLGGDMETLLDALGRPDAVSSTNSTESSSTHPADGLTTLRERYARSELFDEQSEQKVDRLLQTDSPEHAAE